VAPKGLPWVGASGKSPKAADNFTPPGGHPGPNAAMVAGNESVNQFVHESLQGEQKPDKGPIGKRTYG